MNRLGITQPLPVVRMGLPAILYVYFLSCSTRTVQTPSPPPLLGKSKSTVLPQISMLKTENLKVAPHRIWHISRYKEGFVRKTSVETDRTVLCILSIH